MTASGGPRSFTILVNPLSGGGAAPAAVVPVARILRDAGAAVEVVSSPGPQEALTIVDEAVGRGDVVVSAGGDGMLSSLAGRVSARGGVLGMLSAGRGNDFARMLGIPGQPTAVAEVLLRGTPEAVDLIALRLGNAEARVVAGSVYAGVDAVAGGLVDRFRRMPRGLQYPVAAVCALATYRPIEARVVVDEVAHTFRAATVVVANSAYYGSGMRIAPGASVQDGLLDVVVIEAASRRGLIRALPKVYDGRHVTLPAVHVLRGRSVELSGTPALPVGGDGELLGDLPDATNPAVVEVLPRAIRVLLPRRTD